MRKLKVPSLVTIAILTAITVLFWIASGVVRIFVSKPSLKIPSEVLKPLDINLDNKTIESIRQRIYFDKATGPVVEVTSTPTPENTVELNEATESAQTVSPSATVTPSP